MKTVSERLYDIRRLLLQLKVGQNIKEDLERVIEEVIKQEIAKLYKTSPIPPHHTEVRLCRTHSHAIAHYECVKQILLKRLSSFFNASEMRDIPEEYQTPYDPCPTAKEISTARMICFRLKTLFFIVKPERLTEEFHYVHFLEGTWEIAHVMKRNYPIKEVLKNRFKECVKIYFDMDLKPPYLL